MLGVQVAGAAGGRHAGRAPLGAAHGRRDGDGGGQHAARGRAPGYHTILLCVLKENGDYISFFFLIRNILLIILLTCLASATLFATPRGSRPTVRNTQDQVMVSFKTTEIYPFKNVHINFR